MDYSSVAEIKKAGFGGFRRVRELVSDRNILPDVQGVYMVLYINSLPPIFLANGTGGFFKGRNPNVPVDVLESSWVQGTPVIYIGKAGGSDSSATLKSRLRQYLRFGQGKKVGHWGGRYIWQLENPDDLVMCWKAVTDEEPRELEVRLIQKFVSDFGKLPYANLSN